MKVITALILLLYFCSATVMAQENFDKRWPRLFHLPFVKNEWSIDNTERSINGEFASALSILKSPQGENYACKFPARYLLIKTSHDVPEFNLKSCAQLQEFMEMAPSEHISVVFSTESITQPTAAMGHIFLKLQGTRRSGQDVAHSISFFTRLDDVSFPSLILQSFITGKEGYYALAPYSETLNYYLFQEGRNIWEYELKLTDFQRKLLAYHLFELRSFKFTYFFEFHNCATLISDLVNLTYEEAVNAETLWTTPLDIVRAINKKNIVAEKQIHYSNKWLVKKLALQLKISNLNLRPLSESSAQTLESTDDEYLNYRLLKAYNGYLLEKNQIDQSAWQLNQTEIDAKYADISKNKELDINNVKGPHDTIPDSQIGLSWNDEPQSGTEKFIIKFLPASHRLINNLDGYFYDSEVKLFDSQVSYNTKTKVTELYQLDLFSVTSLQPHDPLTGGISSKLSVGNKSFYDFGPISANDNYFLGGIGKTFLLWPNLTQYFLLNAIESSNACSRFCYEFETGTILKEVKKLKSILTVKKTNSANGLSMYSIALQNSLNLETFAFEFDYNRYDFSGSNLDNFETGLTYLF